MKKCMMRVVPVVIAALLFMSFSTRSDADVQVNEEINIPLLHYAFSAPPHLVPVPGSYVYYVPDVEVDIFFYHGYWYRPHEGRWYGGRSYEGPWVHLAPAMVPYVLVAMPHDYRRIPPGHRKIHYRELNRNWEEWEKERHWDRDEERLARDERRGDGDRHGGRERGRGRR